MHNGIEHLFSKATMQKLTQQEVDRICNEHKKWLLNKRKGERAVFSDVDISQRNLSSRDLREAFFIGSTAVSVNFSHSKLAGAFFESVYMPYARAYNVSASEATFKGCDLSFSDFEVADFRRGNFQDSSFSGASLKLVDFSFSNCQNVDFTGATISNVNFSNTNLQGAWKTLAKPGVQDMKTLTQEEVDQICEEHEKWVKNPSQGKRADFSGKDLTGLNLSGRNLEIADFRGTYLEGANLSGSDLSNTKFEHAALRMAELSNTKCQWTDFRRAYLGLADLTNALLYFTNFEGATLRQATLTGIRCHQTSFLNADLRWANRRNADLTGADLTGTVWEERT